MAANLPHILPRRESFAHQQEQQNSTYIFNLGYQAMDIKSKQRTMVLVFSAKEPVLMDMDM